MRFSMTRSPLGPAYRCRCKRGDERVVAGP
jgi:hypothetical protein